MVVCVSGEREGVARGLVSVDSERGVIVSIRATIVHSCSVDPGSCA